MFPSLIIILFLQNVTVLQPRSRRIFSLTWQSVLGFLLQTTTRGIPTLLDYYNVLSSLAHAISIFHLLQNGGKNGDWSAGADMFLPTNER